MRPGAHLSVRCVRAAPRRRVAARGALAPREEIDASAQVSATVLVSLAHLAAAARMHCGGSPRASSIQSLSLPPPAASAHTTPRKQQNTMGKGVSAAEKRERMVKMFQEAAAPFTKKEVEKQGPKTGVIAQAVEGVVKECVPPSPRACHVSNPIVCAAVFRRLLASTRLTSILVVVALPRLRLADL